MIHIPTLSHIRTIVTGPAPGSAAAPIPKEPQAQHNTSDWYNQQTSSVTIRTTRTHFRVAAIFSNHMVIQCNTPITVFGTGTPRTELTITISNTAHTIAQTSTTIADNSNWSATLPAIAASSTTYTLMISDTQDSIIYSDIMFGEVWLASGQSNMELELRNSLHPQEAILTSDDYLLRMYNTPKTGTVHIDAENNSNWQVASPQTVGSMSAVAYYCAAQLRQQLGDNIPIGIIDCYVGGTSVSGWISKDVLESSYEGQQYLERYQQRIAGKTPQDCQKLYNQWQQKFDTWNATIEQAQHKHPDITWTELNAMYGTCPWPPTMTPTSQYRPTGPYEGMIQRIAPYAIRGVMWYQGEEDTLYSNSYQKLLTDMIALWRKLWEQPSIEASQSLLPWYIIQLPRYTSADADDTVSTNANNHKCNSSSLSNSDSGNNSSSTISNAQKAGIAKADNRKTGNAVSDTNKASNGKSGNNTATTATPATTATTAAESGITDTNLTDSNTTDSNTTDLSILNWPLLRAAQQAVAETVEQTYIVSTIDCGEYDNIHPLDKRTVGERLAHAILFHTYQLGDKPQYPVVHHIHVNTHRRQAIVTVQHGQGLHFGHYNGDALGTNIDLALGTPTADPNRRDDVSKHNMSNHGNSNHGNSNHNNSTLSNHSKNNISSSPTDNITTLDPAAAYTRSAQESGFEVRYNSYDWMAVPATIDGRTIILDLSALNVHTQQQISASPSTMGIRYAWKPWGPASVFNTSNSSMLPMLPFNKEILCQ